MKMTKSQVTASRRISDIDDTLRKLRERYEVLSRCSTKHTRVWSRMSNLEHEREMLRVVVTHA